MKKIIITFAVILLGAISMQAQKHYVSTVYLKNGSMLVGDLIYLTEDTVKIQILGGSVFVYPTTEVENVSVDKTRKVSLKKFRGFKEHVVKKDGYYNITYAHFNFGKLQNQDWVTSGIGLENIIGKFITPQLGVGVGLAYTNYDVNASKPTLPLFAEGRYFLTQKPAQPYISMGIGYGFGLNDGQDLIESKGGIYLHPSIGIKFPTTSNAAFIVDMGYTMQDAQFTYATWGGGRMIDDYFFNRFTVRLGIFF